MAPEFHKFHPLRASEIGTRYFFSGLILPGLFLLVLGVGNLAVGMLKEEQYQEVIDELSVEEAVRAENGPTIRPELVTEENSKRSQQRRMKAVARLDFYRLVGFGGKVFIALSFPFFLIAVLLSLVRTRAPAKS